MSTRKRWSEQALQALGIGEDDRRVLAGEGLPVGDIGFLQLGAEPEQGRQCAILAWDGDVPICCYADGAGVFSLEHGRRRRVNTSARTFAATLELFARYCSEVAEIDDDDAAEALARRMVDAMRDADPPAWHASTSYWPIVGAQMIEGNL